MAGLFEHLPHKNLPLNTRFAVLHLTSDGIGVPASAGSSAEDSRVGRGSGFRTHMATEAGLLKLLEPPKIPRSSPAS